MKKNTKKKVLHFIELICGRKKHHQKVSTKMSWNISNILSINALQYMSADALFIRHVGIGSTLGLIGGLLWKFGYHEPNKRLRNDYYYQLGLANKAELARRREDPDYTPEYVLPGKGIPQ